MKYLKSFNESGKDQIEEIKQTIKDILIPISDKGYEIVVKDDVDLNGEFIGTIIIKVVDYKETPLKITDEVKDEFIRMNDYLESEGFNSIKAIYIGDASVYDYERGRVDFSKFISINSGNAFSKRFMSLVFVAEFN
jgi:hypothetical protein